MSTPAGFVAYLRVSTAQQGRSGLGLEAQREAVAKHVAAGAGTVGGRANAAADDAGPTWEAGSKRRGVTADQIRLFARRLQDFLSKAHGVRLRGLPSYERLIQAAYACGFVYREFNLDQAAAVVRRVERDPAVLLGAPFPQVRLYVHGLMRAERWSDCGADFGSRHVHEALTGGALRHLAERLSRATSPW